ncbi:MAG: hypothetical protein HYT79_08720 [Elusimicrobia bacterium]|nr:hypothetical protein [Elusimicrobiota bacterium]
MIIFKVADIFEKKSLDYAIVGGFAVALHGAVRGTVDLDLVLKLSRESFILAEEALNSIGLVSRLPVKAGQVFDFRQEYIQNKNLIAWSFHNPDHPVEIVDIILTHDLAKLKTKKIKTGGRSLPVIAIEDLIAMKELSGRPQDKSDAEALRKLNHE